jgi:cytochrome c oxidase assembly factor CtaG
VAGSGILNVLLRLEGRDRLVSAYGVLIGLKTTAALVLGAAGYLHRRRTIPALTVPGPRAAGRALLWRLITVELLVMAAVSGIAVALARTPAPVPRVPEPAPTPARILTGYDLPPPLEAASWLTQWRPDLTWLTFAALAAAAYLAGVRFLARQGAQWPVARTVCWLAGLAVLLYITCGAAAIYGPVLFSVHTGAHLALAFIVALLLVLGTPLALLERTVPPRADGSLGLRALAEAAHSARRRWLRRPAVSAVLLVGSFIGFYYSPAFRLVLQGHVAHEVVEAFFILMGAVFYSSILAPVPGGRDDGRALTAAATAAVFCLWTAALALSNEPIQAGWFTSLGRDWGPGAVTDQQSTALVVWLIAALPTFLAAGWVALHGTSRSRTRGA